MKILLLTLSLLNNPQDSIELTKNAELSIAKYVDQDFKRYHVWREIETERIYIIVRSKNKFKKRYIN